ncbi:MAG TPA: delta(1)-pyrroline-2-carboxylate reductase family protein [Burkholderiaceae bacterium]|jgi:ornithine cyclodeaminase|nr:delta(1)-pyrroline-2-carboxylate reductase family protein [Burkholderiaceae bacterium]
MTLTVLDAPATARALPYPALAEALSSMLARKHAGQTVAPERLVVPLTGGVLLAMPASDGEFAVTKLVTVHAGNPARGLPSLLGEVLLMRADTGERLLMLDGPTVTARRTAALSALAARRLGGRPRTDLLVIGSGVQARAHVEAFASLLGVTKVRITSRDPANAARLVAHARTLGLQADLALDLPAALAASPLIVTATTAHAPVMPDAVRGDAFVAAVGAYRPDMCELPGSLVRRATVFVDDLAGAGHEAGDLLQAGLDFGLVTALETVTADGPRPRPASPVVFKSVGQALWDLAAARLAWDLQDPTRSQA